MGPPLRLPAHLRLSPVSWRLFWSLETPAKAFTPWWRLLHDRVAHRSWRHRIVPGTNPISSFRSLRFLKFSQQHLAVWFSLCSLKKGLLLMEICQFYIGPPFFDLNPQAKTSVFNILLDRKVITHSPNYTTGCALLLAMAITYLIGIDDLLFCRDNGRKVLFLEHQNGIIHVQA